MVAKDCSPTISLRMISEPGSRTWGVRILFSLCLSWIITLWLGSLAWGQWDSPPRITRDVGEEDKEMELLTLAAPYFFDSSTMGLVGGVAGGASGFWQPQLSFFGTAFGSTNNSSFLGFNFTSIQMPFADRVFLDATVGLGWFKKQRAYFGVTPGFPGERPGSNESQQANFREGSGIDDWIDLVFRYFLPLGHAQDNPIQRFVLDRGIPIPGQALAGDSWNPLKSGLTSLALVPFYRAQNFKIGQGDDVTETSGLKLDLVYDNRDYHPNPSRGGAIRVAASRDFGWGKASETWTFLEAEAVKYFSLGATKWFRQQVLAFDFWTGSSPTSDVVDGMVRNRPPQYMGARLGGQHRLRGFPIYRFNDAAAIYYAGEYRVMPRWNPLEKYKWMGVDFFQLVGFIEVGRVAPAWVLDTLHTDMKTAGGFSIRMFLQKALVRFDFGFSDENVEIFAMSGHPF